MLRLLVLLLAADLSLCTEQFIIPVNSTIQMVQSEPKQCKRFTVGERFMCYIMRQCPVEYSDACLDLDLLDPFEFIRYRCHDSFPQGINSSIVEIINSSTLLNMLQNKEGVRRDNWCLITLFYAPGCPFSARLAPAFNSIPSYFSPLKAVALDATDFSRLNARYGITGTPTVILWINGIAVARMEERDISFNGLKGFIESWTDMESRRYNDIGFPAAPLQIELSRRGDRLYLSLAIFSIILSLVYYKRDAVLDRCPDLVSRFGLNPEEVKRFLNGL